MPVKIFFCYAHEDEALLKNLKTHIKPLQREELIDVWHDRDISPGTEWEKEIDKHLNTSQIILLLVSPDFMDSDYCYSVEMKRAMERHESKEVRVIPVILRSTLWKETPFGKLQALPTDGIPVTDPRWHSLDEAFFNVTEGIYKVAEEILPEIAEKAREKLSETKTRISIEVGKLTAEEYSRCNLVVQSLTSRQIAVLRAFASGLYPRDVAQRLLCSVITVSAHSTKILEICRNTWNIPLDQRLDYHFLRNKFEHYFDYEYPVVF